MVFLLVLLVLVWCERRGLGMRRGRSCGEPNGGVLASSSAAAARASRGNGCAARAFSFLVARLPGRPMRKA